MDFNNKLVKVYCRAISQNTEETKDVNIVFNAEELEVKLLQAVSDKKTKVAYYFSLPPGAEVTKYEPFSLSMIQNSVDRANILYLRHLLGFRESCYSVEEFGEPDRKVYCMGQNDYNATHVIVMDMMFSIYEEDDDENDEDKETTNITDPRETTCGIM